MELGAYLAWAASRPLVWGSEDCCCFLAAWAMLCGKRDPMGFIRGTYDTELSALRRIKEGGGLMSLWSRGMREAGVFVTEHPQAGDGGIIPTVEPHAPEVAAICLGEGRWAAKGARGLIIEPAPHLIAWNLQ